MRACIISQYYPPDAGGASTRTTNAIKGLTERGHRIVVVTGVPHYPHGHVPPEYRARALYIEGDSKVKVIRVWVPPFPHFGAKRLIMYVSFTFLSLFAVPFIGKIDVIWAVSPNYFIAISGFLFKILKRAPLVLDVVDLWPEALVNLGLMKSRTLVKLVRIGADVSYKISDHIVTLNTSLRKTITRDLTDSSRVSIVENAADLDVFRPMETERPKFLRDMFVLMYSGNIGPMYDFDLLFEAASKFVDHKDILFVLRGDGESIGAVRGKLAESGAQNVALFDQVLPAVEVSKHLNYADVLLLPMKRVPNPDISFPLKLIEYFACGKPIVCCAEGATARLAMESEACLVVKPDNPSSLTDAISLLYRDKELRKNLGRNGRKFALKHFSYQMMAGKLERIFIQSKYGAGSRH